MGPYFYIISRIDGDYAFLQRTDISDEDEMQIALALLPKGVDTGDRLIWENFEYRIL